MYLYSSNQQNYQNTNYNNGLAFIDADHVKFPTHSDGFISKENASTDENKVPSLVNKIKKGQYHWNEEQHRLFLEGFEKYGNIGKGKWIKIAEHVGTKTATQVASHAQKHFIRINESANLSRKRKRRSIFYTTLCIESANSWDGSFHPLLYRDNIPSPPPNVETEPIVEQILYNNFNKPKKNCGTIMSYCHNTSHIIE